MRAVIESVKGTFVCCLIENGDKITIPQSLLPKGVGEGDVLQVAFDLDKEATARQKQLIKGYKS